MRWPRSAQSGRGFSLTVSQSLARYIIPASAERSECALPFSSYLGPAGKPIRLSLCPGLRSPGLPVQPSKGLPDLDCNARRNLLTQYVGPRHGFRVVDSLNVAGMNDVVGGIEEIDPVGVHSVGSHAAL
jgi:hypothetical protein